MLVFYSLIASAMAQTLTATGNVSWETGFPGGTAPTGSAAVSIQTGAQVTVNTVVTFLTGTVLTLGTAGTVGTSLVLNNVPFTAAILTWNNGYIQIQGSAGKFILIGAASLSASAGGSVDRQIIGGTFSLTALLGSVNVQGGSLAINGASLDSNAGTWTVSAGANLVIQAGATSWLVSSATFTGAGNVTIQANAELQNNASLTLGGGMSGGTVTWVNGNLTLTGGGSVSVSGGSSLIVAAGGRLKRLSATAQAQVSLAASATLEFAAGTTSWVDAAIVASGNVVVDASATATVSASSSISGTGSVLINGTLIANAGLTVTGPTLVVNAGGDLRIAAGVAANLTQTTFNSGSNWHLYFAGSAFTQVAVQGTLALAGQLYVDVPTQPSATVTLVTATSITGFSGGAIVTAGGSAGRRLLAQGTVVQSGNSIQYVPPNSGSATKPEYLLILPVAIAALW